MSQINPDILRWARETAGLTLEEASKTLSIQEARGISPKDRLEALENGEVEPTTSMLLKMAEKYRRPLIVFYMEKPPIKADRGRDFRTLPDTYSEITSGLVDALIRDVYMRQSILRSAIEDEEDVEFLPFVGSVKFADGVASVVQNIRETIHFDINIFRDQPSPEDAFKYLRSQVEKTGIYVLLIGDLGSHHTAFELEVFRGFALSDTIAPFIVINDKDSRAAWSFTLVHELTHIWLGHTGISSENSELAIEKFCNQVASDLLLPEVALHKINLDNASDFEDQKEMISDFAHSLNLSSSMVAYKLYLMQKINRPTWLRLSREYRNLWLEERDKRRVMQRSKTGGPSYYVIRRHRLGENLISQVHQMIIDGSLTTIKASKVLGVAPKNIQNLVESNLPLKSS